MFAAGRVVNNISDDKIASGVKLVGGDRASIGGLMRFVVASTRYVPVGGSTAATDDEVAASVLNPGNDRRSQRHDGNDPVGIQLNWCSTLQDWKPAAAATLWRSFRCNWRR